MTASIIDGNATPDLTTPDHAHASLEELNTLQGVEAGLRHRAAVARRTSLAALLGIVLVIVSGALAFVWAANLVAGDANANTKQAREAIGRVVQAKDEVERSVAGWRDGTTRAVESLTHLVTAIKGDDTARRLIAAERARLAKGERAKQQRAIERQIASAEAEVKDRWGDGGLDYVRGNLVFADLLRRTTEEGRTSLTQDKGRLNAAFAALKARRQQLVAVDEPSTGGQLESDSAVIQQVSASVLAPQSPGTMPELQAWAAKVDAGIEPLAEAIRSFANVLETQREASARTTYDVTGSLQRLSDVAKAMPENIKTAGETALLLSTLLTRSAIAVLVFFLAQILLGLYRYNARLEHYFIGRADALALKAHLMFETDPKLQEPLWQLMDSLSAQNVDFGRIPNSPSKDAVDLAAAFLKGKTGP
jgi:hypothetical protein